MVGTDRRERVKHLHLVITFVYMVEAILEITLEAASDRIIKTVAVGSKASGVKVKRTILTNVVSWTTGCVWEILLTVNA